MTPDALLTPERRAQAAEDQRRRRPAALQQQILLSRDIEKLAREGKESEAAQKREELEKLRSAEVITYRGHRIFTDPTQIRFRFGVEQQRHAQNQLQALHQSGRPDAQRESQLWNQIAGGLAAQGKYAEAAAITKDDEAKQEYNTRANALEQLGERCACPPKLLQRQPNNAKGIETDAQFPIEVIFTGVEYITFLKCVHCEHVFALEGRH